MMRLQAVSTLQGVREHVLLVVFFRVALDDRTCPVRRNTVWAVAWRCAGKHPNKPFMWRYPKEPLPNRKFESAVRVLVRGKNVTRSLTRQEVPAAVEGGKSGWVLSRETSDGLFSETICIPEGVYTRLVESKRGAGSITFQGPTDAVKKVFIALEVAKAKSVSKHPDRVLGTRVYRGAMRGRFIAGCWMLTGRSSRGKFKGLTFNPGFPKGPGRKFAKTKGPETTIGFYVGTSVYEEGARLDVSKRKKEDLNAKLKDRTKRIRIVTGPYLQVTCFMWANRVVKRAARWNYGVPKDSLMGR